MHGSIQPIESLNKKKEEKKKKRSSDPVQAEYEDGLGFIANKEYGQAALSLHNALVGYEKKNHQDGIANASNQLGNICIVKGEFEKAREHYQRAWDICKRFDDTMSILALSKQFILIHREAKEYDQAIKLCLEGLDTHHNHNNPEGTVEVMETMAEIYIDQGEKKKAADAYRSVASIHLNFNHKNFAKRFEEKAAALEG
jgi:tetratricopeptide (TPR) repeat protein